MSEISEPRSLSEISEQRNMSEISEQKQKHYRFLSKKHIPEILEFPDAPPIAHHLKSLLPRTDQQRHLTLVFDSEFLDDELSPVLAFPVSLFVKQVFTFFDQDFPGGLLSFHFTPVFFLEMIRSSFITEMKPTFTNSLSPTDCCNLFL